MLHFTKVQSCIGLGFFLIRARALKGRGILVFADRTIPSVAVTAMDVRSQSSLRLDMGFALLGGDHADDLIGCKGCAVG